jgi:hypothetical protein
MPVHASRHDGLCGSSLLDSSTIRFQMGDFAYQFAREARSVG